MNEDIMNSENIRQFITKFGFVVVEKSKDPKKPKVTTNKNLLEHFYGKYHKEYSEALQDINGKRPVLKTRAVWLVDEIVKQTQTDSSDSGKKQGEQLAYSSVNGGLSKTDPSEKLVDAAMGLHLRWLEDFFNEMKTTDPSMDDDKLNAEKKLIVQFYEKMKASQGKGAATDNAWIDLEATLEKAQVLVVFNPEVKKRDCESFVYKIWDRYAAIIKKSSFDTAKIPRVFVIHDQVIFPASKLQLKQTNRTEPEVGDGDESSVLRKPEDDFFYEVFEQLKENTPGITPLKLCQLVQEKVFMIGIDSCLCIRPELFVDPQNFLRSAGFGFFIEHGKEWRPFRLEGDVCKLWVRYVKPRIPLINQDDTISRRYPVARFSDTELYSQLNNEASGESIDDPSEPIEDLELDNSSTGLENKVH